MYSIKSHFSGSTVLLTGASGYIGSLVLEKLLRTTRPKRIYVLLRSKNGQDTSSRLLKLFQSSPVFHLIRGRESLLALATPVAGDVLQPGLGLSESDLETLQREVDTIIHCAADIRLESPIQETLRANFEGTRKVLELARGVHSLTSFVHVSTAFSNFNQPSGAVIAEKIYPLHYGDQAFKADELVEVSQLVFAAVSQSYGHAGLEFVSKFD
jgi:fatty acyl-CoA reductase